MVGDNTDSDIFRLVFTVYRSSYLTSFFDNRSHRIDIKQRRNILYNGRDAFKTRTRIDVLISRHIRAVL